MRRAHKWRYLPKLPEFEFLREVEKLPTYITPEEFAKVFRACHTATVPTVPNISAEDCWKALLVFAYTTASRVFVPDLDRKTDAG